MASRLSTRLSALNTNRRNYNGRPTAASNNDDFMTLLNVTRSGAFKRLEEDYRNLMTDYEALQVEYSRVIDLNLDYTRIISELSGINQRGERLAMQQQQEDFESLYNSTKVELEQKTQLYEADIKQLKSEVKDLEQRLTEKQKELDLAGERKRKIFSKLGLPANSPFEEVERKIEELIQHSYNDENFRQPYISISSERLNFVIEELLNQLKLNERQLEQVRDRELLAKTALDNYFQQEYNKVLELNTDYVNIIEKLTERAKHHRHSLDQKEEKEAWLNKEIMNLREKISSCENEIKHLNQSIVSLSIEIAKKSEKIHQLEKRLYQSFMSFGNNNYESENLKTELYQLKDEKRILREQLNKLSQEKNILECHMMQRKFQIMRLRKQLLSSPVLLKYKKLFGDDAFKISGDYFDSCMIVQKLSPDLSNITTKNYCVFCHKELLQAANKWCCIHNGIYANKAWTCCKSKLNTNNGCLKISHCFIQNMGENSFVLTDGLQMMLISS